MQLICHTGGVAALAHPWALKNPVSVIRGLKSAGLHAIEIYRSDGKVAGKILSLKYFKGFFHETIGSMGVRCMVLLDNHMENRVT